MTFDIFRKNSFDYLKLHLFFPKVGIDRDANEWIDCVKYNYYLKFDTGIVFSKDKCLVDSTTDFWYIEVKLLGFGVGLTRQTGY